MTEKELIEYILDPSTIGDRKIVITKEYSSVMRKIRGMKDSLDKFVYKKNEHGDCYLI